ncbi:hypothetical protein GCM10022267_84430 [Lentzea roselyniae]|uniref:Uncharacterized protein n=1 Tax=Lentzea roselyniae TaxID=531940 RepID=A0ABP7CCI5_9PSEU
MGAATTTSWSSSLSRNNGYIESSSSAASPASISTRAIPDPHSHWFSDPVCLEDASATASNTMV